MKNKDTQLLEEAYYDVLKAKANNNQYKETKKASDTPLKDGSGLVYRAADHILSIPSTGKIDYVVFVDGDFQCHVLADSAQEAKDKAERHFEGRVQIRTAKSYWHTDLSTRRS